MWLLFGVTVLLLGAMIFTVLRLLKQSEEHVDSVKSIKIKIDKANLRPDEGEADSALKKLIEEDPYRTGLDFQHWDLTKENMKSIGKLDTLTHLSLSDCTFKDSWLRYISHLPLTTLDLAGTVVTDDGMKYVAKIKTLKKLEIFDTGVSGKALEILQPLTPSLTFLSVNAASLSDSDMAQLSNFSNLTNLNMKGTSISVNGCESIAKLQNLQTIDFGRSRFSKAGLEKLASLPRLTDIRLKGCSIDDDTASALFGFPGLIHIELNDNDLSDKTMDGLAKMQSLQSLGVRDNEKITASAVARFRKAKPNCSLTSGTKDRSDRL
jgi:hypothetical protein